MLHKANKINVEKIKFSLNMRFVLNTTFESNSEQLEVSSRHVRLREAI